MRREDLERLRAGLPHGVIEETEPAASGSFTPHPRGPGEYVVVVVNEANTPASRGICESGSTLQSIRDAR